MIITAIKLVGGEDLDTALLVLRDRQCKPSLVTEMTATFKFNVNTCGTSRKVRTQSHQVYSAFGVGLFIARPGKSSAVISSCVDITAETSTAVHLYTF